MILFRWHTSLMSSHAACQRSRLSWEAQLVLKIVLTPSFCFLPPHHTHTTQQTTTSSPTPCHNTSSTLLFFIFLPKFVPSAKHSTSTNLNPYSTLSSKRWTKRKTRHSKTTLSISVDKRRYSPQSPEPTISNSPTWYPHNPHPTVP